MHLYLIRHPKPLVSADVCYGSSDVGVDGPALDEVLGGLAASAMVLPIAGLPKGLGLYSSPLQRCAGLARRLADVLDCGTPMFDARLAEMHFGNWELRSWGAIPRCEVDAWAADLTMYRPGGGESVLEMAERVRGFYFDVLLKQQDAVVVCHAGTIRILLACSVHNALNDIALHAASNPMNIAYGQVITLVS